ncbi:MAG: O-antigen ligase family protein [Clostridia bacterium]|nr:O-antigen ligase family protein [Clostridia bacterium]
MKGALGRELSFKPVKGWLSRNVERLAALVALMFFCTPVIEMVICLFNKTERILPLVQYPKLVLSYVLPASIALAGLAYIGAFCRLRAQGRRVGQALRENPAVVIFLALAAWMVASTLVNDALFRMDYYRNEPFALVLAYILVFLFCGMLIDGPRKERLAMATIAMSMALGVYAIVRYDLIKRGVEVSAAVYATAVFPQENHYGYYLAIHIALCGAMFSLGSRRTYRGVALVGLALNTAALSLNNTFGAWLACLVTFVFQGVVIFIVRRKVDWRTVAALAVFLAVTGLMNVQATEIVDSAKQFTTDVKSVVSDPEHSDSAGSTRWLIWKFTVDRIRERPLFGFGNEGINEMLQQATGSSRPHCEPLQYAVFYGIPAAVIYVCGVLAVFLRGYHRRRTLDARTLLCLVAAFAYFTSSMFGNTMYYTAPFFFLLMGMGYEKKGQ